MEMFAAFLGFLLQIAPFVVILAMAATEILAITATRKRNGSVVWKPSKVSAAAVFQAAFTPAMMVFVVVVSGTWTELIIIVMIAVVSIPFIPPMLRALYHGIYEKRLVGDQFVSDWNQIERVIVMPDRLRLVDQERGAMDFMVGRNDVLAVLKSVRMLAPTAIEERSQNEEG